ncbi:MAG: LysR family transcriptional regulator [Clostridiales bacterium]|nr:LysR family transcriptional regulator [Clostridiales bacterium]
MNILHMKYAAEVARCGSINKAADELLMNQPNLSRAIKELEASLGVEIFIRTPKGMVVTPEGETFLRYAEKILKQVDEVESMFRNKDRLKKHFSISVPRASYICEAFSNFSLALNKETDAEIFYKETNSRRTIKNILESDYRLGIIRYAEHFDKYYKDMLEEKGLAHELITEFSYTLIMSKDSPLAAQEVIIGSDLEKYIEISHADPFVPSLPFAEVKREELPDNISRRIFVFERASQFELLSKNPKTFMWVSPVPEKLLSIYGLVQKPCANNVKLYKDLIIHRKDYRLSDLDNMFVAELCKSKRALFREKP